VWHGGDAVSLQGRRPCCRNDNDLEPARDPSGAGQAFISWNGKRVCTLTLFVLFAGHHGVSGGPTGGSGEWVIVALLA
jgi:hypothetical protein